MHRPRFKIRIPVKLSYEQSCEAQRYINFSHLGDINCNYLDEKTNKFESKYPEKETDIFLDSSRKTCATQHFTLTVEVDENGNFIIIDHT